ncbi:MAG: TolC family protein [Helicobacteraceae bacterium]|jgi:outer membrane protein TolC|nr:TolC family protein [Helicobacteraceae bacterium]
MRNISLFFALCYAAFALDRSHLSEEIQSAIAHKEASIEAGRKRLKYDFLGEARLSGSITQNKGVGATDWEKNEQASANFSQDIFRSGGISASMRHAEYWAQAERIRVAEEINGYLRQLATLILQARQDQIRLRQNDLGIKNAEIALLIKQRQYEVGEADITQLNDALQTKNNLQKTRLELKSQYLTRLDEIAKLSPLEPESIPLAPFAPITRAEYEARSLAMRLAKAQSMIAKEQHSITTSSYLPTLSASAGISHTRSDMIDGESYNYGVTLSMPLSFTEGWAIEEKKLESLRANSQERATAQEVRRTYAQSLNAIDAIEGNIEVSRQNITLYDSLIAVANAQVNSGDRSRYDLQTLENSRQSDLLEIELSNIAIQIELAKLHYAIDKETTQ